MSVQTWVFGVEIGCVLLAALVRMSGVLQKSTEVMQSMQQLVSVSEISGTMRELSKEMMKVNHEFIISSFRSP